MKNKIVFSVILLITEYSVFAQFEYKRELETPTGLWHRIEIPPALLQENENNLSDVRVLGVRDEDTLIAPYVVQKITPEIQEKEASLDVLNHSVNRSTGYSYVTFRLKEERDYNYMNFEVMGNNFNIYLTLEGSHDGKDWFEFANRRRIVGHDDEYATYRYTEISFPTVNYPFVRVKYLTKHPRWYLFLFDKIYKVRGASVKERKVVAGEIDSLTCVLDQKQDRKAKTTLLEIDLPERRRVSSLSLSTSDTLDFYRRIEIEAVTDSVQNAKGEYRYLTRSVYNGVITSYEKPVYEFDEVFTNKFVVTVNDRDNMKLSFDDAKAASFKQFLAVRFPDKGEYSLYYGNAKLSSPSYDIVRFGDQLKQEMPLLKVSESVRLQEEEQEKVYDSKSYYMWGGIILALLVMGFFTVKMISQEKSGE